MKGSERIRSASLRSRRAYHGTDTSATPIAAVFRPMPRPTVTAIARISGGKREDRSPSMRIATPSLDAAERAGEQSDQATDERPGERSRA